MLIIFMSLGAGLLTWGIANSLIKWKRHNKQRKLQSKLTQNQASLAPGTSAKMKIYFN